MLVTASVAEVYGTGGPQVVRITTSAVAMVSGLYRIDCVGVPGTAYQSNQYFAVLKGMIHKGDDAETPFVDLSHANALLLTANIRLLAGSRERRAITATVAQLQSAIGFTPSRAGLEPGVTYVLDDVGERLRLVASIRDYLNTSRTVIKLENQSRNLARLLGAGGISTLGGSGAVTSVVASSSGSSGTSASAPFDRWSFTNPEWGMVLDGVTDDSAGILRMMDAAKTVARTRGWRQYFRQALDVDCLVTDYTPNVNAGVLYGCVYPVDGVTITPGMRIAVKNGTPNDALFAGIWIASTTAWTRATDLDSWTDLTGGGVYSSTIIRVVNGTLWEDSEHMVGYNTLGTGSYTGTPSWYLSLINPIGDDVRLTLPAGYECRHTQRFTVPFGCALDAQGKIISHMSTRAEFAIKALQHGRIIRLNQYVDNGSGVQLVSRAGVNHGDIITQNRLATSSVDCWGLNIKGFAHTIRSISVGLFGGNVLDESADLQVGTAYIVYGIRQLELLSTHNNLWSNVTIDNTAAGGVGIRLNTCQNTRIYGNVFNLDGTMGANTNFSTPLLVGDASYASDGNECFGVTLDLNVYNTGGIVCDIGNMRESLIRLNTARDYFTYGSKDYVIEQIVKWQDRARDSVVIEANVAASIPTIASFAAGVTAGGVVTYNQSGLLKRVQSNGTTFTVGAGGGGSSRTTGTVTVDFGAAPGSSAQKVVVTGQTGIALGSVVEVFFVGAATADHSAYEHETILPLHTVAVAGDIIAGTGFTIYVTSSLRLSGLVSLAWAWQ